MQTFSCKDMVSVCSKYVQRLVVSGLTALALYICGERFNSIMELLGKT